MFNLTNTYRRDSDIVRRVNDIESTITKQRFDWTTGDLLQDDDSYLDGILKSKQPYGKPIRAGGCL